tara:strand:- start:177 stop:584 length:408 start_codon:yes stop_codon:yes gene_type:complete
MNNDATSNPVSNDNQTTQTPEAKKRSAILALFNFLWSISEQGKLKKVRPSKSGNSINCYNPLLGWNEQHLEQLAINAGFDTVIHQKAGRTYKDAESGEEMTSDVDMLVITTDSTALTPQNADEAVDAVLAMQLNS